MSAKHVRYVVSNVLVLVRRSLAAPPLVNSRSVFVMNKRAYTTCLQVTGAISSQVYGIRAERERDCGSVHLYATAASERSNAESVKLAQRGLWVI